MSKVIGLEGLEVGDTIVVGARGTARIAVIADDAEMIGDALQMRISEAKRVGNELPPHVKWVIEKPGQVKITFVAKPIETAPKDKQIMVFVPDGRHFWVKCQYDPAFGWELYANGFPYGIAPTHWCYPHEMEVPNV